MTQTPEHPSEMGLNVDDVIRYEKSDDWHGFTVGRNYTVLDGYYISDDYGLRHPISDINPDRRFTLVSRADDINSPHGDFPSENYLSPADDGGRWFSIGTRSDWEYQINANGLPEGRPRKPKVQRVEAHRGLVASGPNERGFVTTTDDNIDWLTFSEKEDL